MSVEALNEVAQGRVWTGRQALGVGLVDHMGGLNKALNVAAGLAFLPSSVSTFLRPYGGYRVETFREARGGLPFPFGRASVNTMAPFGTDVLAVCDDSVACSGLVSSESLGISPIFEALGLNKLLAYNIAQTSVGNAFVKAVQSFLSTGTERNSNLFTEFFEDFF